MAGSTAPIVILRSFFRGKGGGVICKQSVYISSIFFPSSQALRVGSASELESSSVAGGCTEVLVWHAPTVATKVPRLRVRKRGSVGKEGLMGRGTSLPALLESLRADGVVAFDRAAGRDMLFCTRESCTK